MSDMKNNLFMDSLHLTLPFINALKLENIDLQNKTGISFDKNKFGLSLCAENSSLLEPLCHEMNFK